MDRTFCACYFSLIDDFKFYITMLLLFTINSLMKPERPALRAHHQYGFEVEFHGLGLKKHSNNTKYLHNGL